MGRKKKVGNCDSCDETEKGGNERQKLQKDMVDNSELQIL